MDFDKKASELLSQAKVLLPDWLPNGKIVGSYYVCASLHGGEGDSFKVNLDNGLWAEFNGGTLSGKDLIALYAAIHGLSNGQALIRLEGRSSFLPAPVTVNPPIFFAIDNRPPVSVFEYRNRDNSLNFYIARYHKKDGSKSFMPWSWDGQKWVLKAWPANRPLFGLEKLRDNQPVMIVEGEKKVLAGREVVRELYDIVSASGGCKALNLTDFSPIYGRKVILWPDADEAGITAFKTLGERLLEHCPEVKLIDPSLEPSRNSGWDIADAVAEGWNLDKILDWGGPRCYAITPSIEEKNVNFVDVSQIPVNHPTTEINLQARWIEAGIQQNKNLQPILNEDNILRILDSRYGWGQFIWWDIFHKKYFTDRDEALAVSGKVREWSDSDLLRMFVRLQREWGFAGIKYHQVERAISSFGNDCVKNEPVDWVRSLKWDGQPRLSTFFQDYMGVKHSKYMISISSNFWVSMIARLFDPGCQADYMCVFLGNQGIKKTKSLRAIGGKWYASVRATVGTPNFYSAIQGKLLCEIAELEAFSKAGIESIKEMLTSVTDRFRIPYAKYHADFNRSCIFVGTSNDEDFLIDITGGRRFWPIKIGVVKYDSIERDRNQLFAEALVKYQAGEKWYEFDTDEMREVLEGHRVNDPWEGLINEYLKQHETEGISLDEIFKEVIHIENAKRGIVDQRRVGKILRFFGWRKKGRQTESGYRIYWYPLSHEIFNGED